VSICCGRARAPIDSSVELSFSVVALVNLGKGYPAKPPHMLEFTNPGYKLEHDDAHKIGNHAVDSE